MWPHDLADLKKDMKDVYSHSGLLKTQDYLSNKDRTVHRGELEYKITDHKGYKIVERIYDHFLVMQPKKHKHTLIWLHGFGTSTHQCK
jgi:hypothetical protein